MRLTPTHEPPAEGNQALASYEPLGWDDDPLEDTESAAQFLRVRPATLAVWRSTGRFGDELPHVKMGSRVFYRRSVLYRFRENRTRQQTKTAA